jgi:hypothetical protein
MARIPVARNGAFVKVALGKGVLQVKQNYRFAYGLKNMARLLSNKAHECKEVDGIEMEAFVTGAVTFSYSYLEAAFNEFVLTNAISTNSPLSEAEKAVMRAIGTEVLRPQKKSHVLDLFNLALRLLGKKEFEPGGHHYQSANLVRRLRNLLIHPVPGTVVTYEEDEEKDLSTQQTIMKQLKGPLGLGKHATFPWDVLSSDCAKWAVRSCEDFFHEFTLRSGVDPGFKTT